MLEQMVEGLEREKKEMTENIRKQKEEIEVVRGSLSSFITENTLLKNDAKQRRK